MKTSSLHIATLTGLHDELIKISAAAEHADRKKRVRLKKWLKNTLLISAGSATGTGAAMLGDMAVTKAFGKQWASLHPKTRISIAAPIASALGAGTMVLGKKMMETRHKQDRE